MREPRLPGRNGVLAAWRKIGVGLRRASVRSRSTAAAVIVVAVAMGLGAAVLLLLLQRALITGVSDAADGRLADVAGQVSEEGTAGLARDLTDTTRPSQLIQVLDASGRVVAASSTRVDSRPLTDLRPAPGAVLRAEVGEMPLLDDDHAYLIVTQGASYGGQTYTVVVASSVQTQRDTVATVAKYLLIGFPVAADRGRGGGLAAGRAGARAGGADPGPGAGHRVRRSDRAGPGAGDPGRDRAARGDHERDARSAADRAGHAAAVRVGCQPRTPVAAGHADRGAGGHRSRYHRACVAGTASGDGGRDRADAAAGRGPAAAREGGRHRPADAAYGRRPRRPGRGGAPAVAEFRHPTHRDRATSIPSAWSAIRPG